MKSWDEDIFGRNMVMKKNPPSLVDLCIKKAIDNLRYLGDVGETDIRLLDPILSHCTKEQLAHIEESTVGRDLSQVTNRLWKRFYETDFGVKSVNLVIERMQEKKVSFKWQMLYEAKKRDMEEAQEKSFNRIKELYKQEVERKQKRQVKICTKVPPSSKRSFFGGGYGPSITNTKSNILKKARIEVLKSQEVKNLTALKKNTVQKHNCLPARKPPLNPGKSSGSSSNHGGPTGRRF
ncbi:uncharacterized protein LOC124920956 [Impatiens glandulifera]|uniref:uncharacterized protein LOC124920956 n=1 Tax=Impatiens glandulifera TaxID=253017 RepID=UPI001FB0CF8B|nr:uncharacterized protein LOC124920956 [Impatiens glandulifera]